LRNPAPGISDLSYHDNGRSYFRAKGKFRLTE